MRSLPDVNVLIALLDADHSMHRRAIEWFGAEAAKREGIVSDHSERLHMHHVPSGLSKFAAGN